MQEEKHMKAAIYLMLIKETSRRFMIDRIADVIRLNNTWFASNLLYIHLQNWSYEKEKGFHNDHWRRRIEIYDARSTKDGLVRLRLTLKQRNGIQKVNFMLMHVFSPSRLQKKALKAYLYSIEKRKIITHSTFTLAKECAQENNVFNSILSICAELDKNYIPSVIQWIAR